MSEETIETETITQDELLAMKQALAEDAERHRQLFDQMVAQEDDNFGAGGIWPESDDGKRQMLAEIQDLVITFIMARLQRYSENVGEPQRVKFGLQVLVEGTEMIKNELADEILVPQKKLILPG